MSRQEEDKVNFAYFVSEIKDVFKDINEHVPRIPYYYPSSHMKQNAVYSMNNTISFAKMVESNMVFKPNFGLQICGIHLIFVEFTNNFL